MYRIYNTTEIMYNLLEVLISVDTETFSEKYDKKKREKLNLY